MQIYLYYLPVLPHKGEASEHQEPVEADPAAVLGPG
jgi:hypothetical protein